MIDCSLKHMWSNRCRNIFLNNRTSSASTVEQSATQPTPILTVITGVREVGAHIAPPARLAETHVHILSNICALERSVLAFPLTLLKVLWLLLFFVFVTFRQLYSTFMPSYADMFSIRPILASCPLKWLCPVPEQLCGVPATPFTVPYVRHAPSVADLRPIFGGFWKRPYLEFHHQ